MCSYILPLLIVANQIKVLYNIFVNNEEKPTSHKKRNHLLYKLCSYLGDYL